MSQDDVSDSHLIYWALNMWANLMETGDVTFGAVDADNMKLKINPLTTDQMRRIVRLRDLSQKYLSE